MCRRVVRGAGQEGGRLYSEYVAINRPSTRSHARGERGTHVPPPPVALGGLSRATDDDAHTWTDDARPPSWLHGLASIHAAAPAPQSRRAAGRGTAPHRNCHARGFDRAGTQRCRRRSRSPGSRQSVQLQQRRQREGGRQRHITHRHGSDRDDACACMRSACMHACTRGKNFGHSESLGTPHVQLQQIRSLSRPTGSTDHPAVHRRLSARLCRLLRRAPASPRLSRLSHPRVISCLSFFPFRFWEKKCQQDRAGTYGRQGSPPLIETSSSDHPLSENCRGRRRRLRPEHVTRRSKS
jgi:hypothetical protein